MSKETYDLWQDLHGLTFLINEAVKHLRTSRRARSSTDREIADYLEQTAATKKELFEKDIAALEQRRSECPD